MKVLIIAPLPPPHTGNSLPVASLIKRLSKHHEVSSVNINKSSHRSGLDSIGRVGQVLVFIYKVWKQRNADVIYLTIAESYAGNLRDLFFYLILYRKLDRLVLHLLGGSNMKKILSGTLMGALNIYFINRVKNVVVEGDSQKKMFLAVRDSQKIVVINNFAESYLFQTREKISRKFIRPKKVKILFLSNMLPGKGYLETVDAFMLLLQEGKHNITLRLAGKFVSDLDEREIMKKIEGRAEIEYLGSVSGALKRDLLFESHILCLPTYYPYEGQPFVLIEAMAAGCAIITTDHGGISNIFENEKNGLYTDQKSIDSLFRSLKTMISKLEKTRNYGLFNRDVAESNFQETLYLSKMMKLFEND